jgi:DNA transposition AAA+ family ATPase
MKQETALATIDADLPEVAIPEAELIDVKEPIQMSINVSGDTVVTSTSEYPEDQRLLLRWAFHYAREHNIPNVDFQKTFGVSYNALYRVWTDRYRHPETKARISPHGICRELAKAKSLIEERASIRRVPFIETSVWRRINTVCAEALVSQSIALIYGEPQIGKTACLEEHMRRNNHGQTKYVPVPATSGVQYLVREIATACKVPNDKGIEVLRGRINKSIDSKTLLIFDELHLIFLTYSRQSVLRALEFIRQIHDRTKCGMVLCGTRVWREQLETSDYSQFLKQLRRRSGGLEAQLPDHVPAEDLDLFAHAYHLPPAKGEARELILAINKEHGLGYYVKTLARAARAAQKKQQRYTWDHFTNAYSILTRLKD